MTAILFGSISTLADTSELQRQAFNEAFSQHGLDWQWERAEYRELLAKSGGADRVAAYAAERGVDVDAASVHATKSAIFQKQLADSRLEARPGVLEAIRSAKSSGIKVGLVTTTSPENVAALIEGLGPEITASDFDVIVDTTSVEAPKPDGAAYAFALDRLGEQPDSCVAVEDNLDGVRSATAAQVRCIAFPNENTAGHDFGSTTRVERLTDALLAPADGNA